MSTCLRCGGYLKHHPDGHLPKHNHFEECFKSVAARLKALEKKGSTEPL